MARNAQSFIVTTLVMPGKAGAIQFVRSGNSEKVAGFNHCCPCGCGKWSFIRLNPEVWAPGTETFWTREGDDLHMTCSPSIGIKPLENGQYHWHGYLRNGVFEEC